MKSITTEARAALNTLAWAAQGMNCAGPLAQAARTAAAQIMAQGTDTMVAAYRRIVAAQDALDAENGGPSGLMTQTAVLMGLDLI